MRPVLKRLHSPDILDLSTYQPADPQFFGFLLQALYGPEGEKGEESFDILVCTPSWLARELESASVLSGRHRIFMQEYNFERLRAFLLEYAKQCSGKTWEEAAKKLGRLGKWEFEDYSLPPNNE